MVVPQGLVFGADVEGVVDEFEFWGVLVVWLTRRRGGRYVK